MKVEKINKLTLYYLN